MTTQVAKKTTGTGVAKWADKINAALERQDKMEASIQTLQRYQIKTGHLYINDKPVPNSEIVVSIAWNLFENVRYDHDYDPQSPEPPSCWARGDDDKTMVPHEIVVAAGINKADTCAQCQYSAFGSADRGNGKGCQNRRSLATIATGTLVNGKFKPFTEAELEKSEIILLSVPPTSFKAISAYLKTAKAVTQKPPFLLNTRIKTEPNSDTIYSMIFDLESEIPEKLYDPIMNRLDMAEEALNTPFALPSVDTKPKSKTASRGASAAKPAATKGKPRY